MESTDPIKVAVIGGGCASMTAAFELSRPEHRGRFAVTVYQQGWRLGGKGASGRGPSGRIEEHGLHIWLGFYENAFRIMRECYEELGRSRADCPIATWTDAFKPDPYVGVVDWSEAEGWVPWIASFPPLPGQPGDPLTRHNPFQLSSYVFSMLRAIRVMLQAASPDAEEAAARKWQPAPKAPGAPELPNLLEWITRLLGYGSLASYAAVFEALHLLEALFRLASPFPQNPALQLIEAVHVAVRQSFSVLQRDAHLRRIWEVVDLVLATLRGFVRHGVVWDPRGLDALDEYDSRDWLRENGAAESSVNSCYLRGLYDLAFCYEEGDVTQPSVAAGQAIRAAVRLFFTYRGALFWKMQAGMGDIVFAPLYEVLVRRGVRFEFFHRLEEVKLSREEDLAPGETPYVEALRFDVQAEAKEGTYAPLVSIKGLPSWPSEPIFERLENGEQLRREGRDFESFWDRRRERTRDLWVIDDFDYVVLGVGLGAIPHLCDDILKRDQRWRDMVAQVKTVATQSLQVWLSDDLVELGWNHASVTLSAFVEPFDTWADMSHLLPYENWDDSSSPARPKTIAYFCSALADERYVPERPEEGGFVDYPAARRHEIWASAEHFLRSDLPQLWKRAAQTGDFCWDRLVATDGAHSRGPERLRTQFVSANVNPTDRYVLTVPGSSQYRISPLDNTYDNLTIAGDWTACGFNEGCVEAAVISGRLAAHALSGFPRLEDIVGYDHP